MISKRFQFDYCKFQDLSIKWVFFIYFFYFFIYHKLFSKLVEILPMQPSINTGLPKHPHLTLMTSVKSSNVKGKLRKLTCWGRLKRWTTVGTATSHTANWKRPWRLWVAQGTCETNSFVHTLASGFWLQSWVNCFKIFWEALETLHRSQYNVIFIESFREERKWPLKKSVLFSHYLISIRMENWTIQK